MRRQRSGSVEWYIHRGPRDALDDLPLYILAAARDALGPAKLIKRRLQYYSLAWLKEGECWYWSETQPRSVRVQVGQVIAAGPGLLHAYGGHGEPFREDYVAFFGPVADSFCSLGLFDASHPLITVPNPERIGEIVEIVKQGSVEAHLRAGLLLQRVLIEARFHAGHEGSPHYPAIRRLLKRVADTPEVHLTNRQMADSCEMSDSHFRKLFREEVGMAPHRYCERARMHQAATWLSQSNRRVLDIAGELGYDDSLYFSKRFRTIVGLSPRAYRRSIAPEPPESV